MTYYNRSAHRSEKITLPELLSLVAHKTNYPPRLYCNGYRGKCPAHEDNKPSCTFSESGGKRLAHCFSGCTINDICASIGIPVRALFD